MRTAFVHVEGANDGKPILGARVTLYIYQFMASGQKQSTTNSNGDTEFVIDVDQYAEISIDVNGKEKKPRASICDYYCIRV